MQAIDIRACSVTDGAALAQIRARAMRESLEAVGRFDETRVRTRFLDKYNPAVTHKIFIPII